MYLGRVPMNIIEKTRQRRARQPLRNVRPVPPPFQRALDFPLRQLVGNAPAAWQHIEPDKVKRATSMPALVGKSALGYDDCIAQ